MTFNEIEKEFDELFVKKVMLIDEPDKLAYEEMKWQVEPERIKSFLKQSFIKYLQSEVVACNQYKSYYNQSGDQFNKGKHGAMSHMINRLEAQIKELDTSNN